MKPTFFIYVILSILIGITGRYCDTVEDPYAPARPRWVPRSAPTDTLQQGIRPYSDSEAIYLEWYQNIEEDLSGYRIYRGRQIDQKIEFETIADIEAYTASGSDTTHIDDTAVLDTDYSYFLKAYDQAGNFSEPSDTIRYRLIQKVEPLSPRGEITTGTPSFEWYDFTSEAYEYVLRLETRYAREVIWISRFSRSNYGDFSQDIDYNQDSSASLNSLEPGSSYQWSIRAISLVDQDNSDIGGSQSIRGYFTVSDQGG